MLLYVIWFLVYGGVITSRRWIVKIYDVADMFGFSRDQEISKVLREKNWDLILLRSRIP